MLGANPLGVTDPGDSAANTVFDPGYGAVTEGRFTSSHAAFMLVVIGLVGLWIVSKVFKGA